MDNDQIVAALQAIPSFESLPEDQLCWLAENGEIKRYAAGESIITKGDRIEFMAVLLEGQIVFRVSNSGENRISGHIEQGEFTGVLPFSRAEIAIGNGVAEKECLLLSIEKRHFPEMIRRHYELVEMLVHHMTDRVRQFTTFEQQNEKLMSLGKLSAGLAHELNNPASAMVRSSAELKRHISMTPERYKKIMRIDADAEQLDRVNELLYSKIEAGTVHLSLLEKTEQSDELADWLDDHGVEDPFECAELFVEFGFERSDLEHLADLFAADDLPAVVLWMENVLTAEMVVNEIQDAASRISDIVGSVKEFSQMDRSKEARPVDLRAGIQSTITLLNHKTKRTDITILNNIPDDLPEFKGLVGELNQVWMNLIDNAVDAVGETGTITISAEATQDHITITVQDDGPGIPEEVRSRIFDPFFTTKAMGKGTGLGLDIVHKIITRHGGSIEVESEPGSTTFAVHLPIQP